MNDQILFDRLRYIDKLTGAGIPESQARAHADAMENALRDSVATKSDINGVRQELAAVQQHLENKIEIAIRDLTIRGGGMLIAAVAVLAAIKFFG